EEGQEAPFLLTSFGIPVPAILVSESPPPLADIFIVNGPGFTTGLDLVSPARLADSRVNGKEGGAAPTDSRFPPGGGKRGRGGTIIERRYWCGPERRSPGGRWCVQWSGLRGRG